MLSRGPAADADHRSAKRASKTPRAQAAERATQSPSR